MRPGHQCDSCEANAARRSPGALGSCIEVCVVGGGPAGLILTRELASRGLPVLLLESGPPTGSAADLSAAAVCGDPIWALDPMRTRFRGLGGNANQWSIKAQQTDDGWIYGVRYGTLTEQALGSRPWLDVEGWPIGPAELNPWYRKAHALLGMGDFDYELAAEEANQTAWLGPESIDCRSFRFGPRDRYLVDLRGQLMANPLVRITEGATVARLHQRSSGGPAAGLTYFDSEGIERSENVSAVVLACGAIENARLLLNSESQRGGIGNEAGNVGRYFMDHPLFSVGDIHLDNSERLKEFTYFDLISDASGPRHGHVVSSPQWCEANNATEIAAVFFPRPRRSTVEAIEALKSLASNPGRFVTRPGELVRSLGKAAPGIRDLPWLVNTSVRRKQSLLPGFARGGWSDDPSGLGFSEVEVLLQCEQAPLRNSRVSLSQQLDRFDMPLPEVSWLLGAQTRASVLAFQGHIAKRVQQESFGVYVPRAGNLERLETPASMAHHMGTTRMSRRPQDGVVDLDCKVHTCPNLFIAGSSVFPTGGYVNPTLTIAALAIRLASHLADSSS